MLFPPWLTVTSNSWRHAAGSDTSALSRHYLQDASGLLPSGLILNHGPPPPQELICKNASGTLKFHDIICCRPPPTPPSPPASAQLLPSHLPHPQSITLRPDSKWVTSDRSHWSAGWESSPSDKREHVSVSGQALTCLTPSFAMRPQNRRPFVNLWVGAKTRKDFGYLEFF